MKKIAFTLLIVALLNIANAFAQGGTTGPLTWNIEEGVLTISGEGEMPDYYYPYYAPWYEYQESIKAIVIEDGVTCIGEAAFVFCKNVISIIIPNGVTNIGEGAFYACTNLTLITIPNSVTSLGEVVFYNCISLSSIIIPNSVKNIGKGAFYSCKSLKSIVIPNSITYIYEKTFYQCTSLASVTIPCSVIGIRDGAFYACENLTLITNFNPTPIDINHHVFEMIIQSACTLQVPANAISDYKNAPEWKEFNIVGIEVGIVETDNEPSLRIFPNPTNGELTMDNGELTIENIEIFDVMGKCVTTVETLRATSLQSTPTPLTISYLPSGVYFIRIQTDKGLITKKIIKQ